MIQFVMRQCFVFSDLLLAREPAGGAGLAGRAAARRPADAAVFQPRWWRRARCRSRSWGLLRSAEPRSAPAAFGRGLLAFLAAVQILLLPINYGVLIGDKTLPRVAALGDKPLADGEEAWLVWEGKDGVTFLVRDRDARAARS